MEQSAYDLIENFEDWFWWHRARRNIIKETILNNINECESKRLLDIGCGSGGFLREIQQHIPNCTGIEGREYEHKKFDNIKIVDIFDNGLTEGAFDIITALDVMEHIEDEARFLSEIKRLLNRGGSAY